jgi:uncharacterized protein YuzE
VKIEYDQKTDTLYINFNSNKVKKTQSVNNLVLVDLDEQGQLVHIEILSASHYGDVSELTYKLLSEAVASEAK